MIKRKVISALLGVVLLASSISTVGAMESGTVLDSKVTLEVENTTDYSKSVIETYNLVRGTAVNLGQVITTNWTSADNGKTKTYDMNIQSGSLITQIKSMKFASGQELQWKVELLNSSGSVIKTANATDCPLSNGNRVIKFDGLSAGKYSIRLNPNMHVSGGTVSIPVSFSQDGNIDTTDWKSHWAKEGIEKAMNAGWIDKADKFRPDDSMTRAEFVKVLNRAFGLTNGSGKVFSDTANHWAKKEIDIAVTNGICNGVSATQFNPDGKITRQEASKMVVAYKKKADTNHDKINQFTDKNLIDAWAKDYVEGAVEAGYMNGVGNGKFNPRGNITRAEAIVTISRVN